MKAKLPMTHAALQQHTCKDLAQMARKRGVTGWHSMRKDQLVRAILKANKAKGHRVSTGRHTGSTTAVRRKGTSLSGSQTGSKAAKPADPRARREIQQLQAKLDQIKNLATESAAPAVNRRAKERLVVMVRGPYWLHAHWELSSANIHRARAAMGQHWHSARPALRLLTVGSNGVTRLARTIFIHGGVRDWYVDVQDPPGQFQLEIGYVAEEDDFHRIASSNVVTTPTADVCEAIDEIWGDLASHADRIFAMSGGYSSQGGSKELQEMLEERLGRPIGSPMQTRFGAGAAVPLHNSDDFSLVIDAEIVVYGATHHDAHVTLKGEPVRLRPDGTFAVRLNLPERRQVIPVVASSGDGVEQRTVSIAVERNTKIMEPVRRDI